MLVFKLGSADTSSTRLCIHFPGRGMALEDSCPVCRIRAEGKILDQLCQNRNVRWQGQKRQSYKSIPKPSVLMIQNILCSNVASSIFFFCLRSGVRYWGFKCAFISDWMVDEDGALAKLYFAGENQSA
jgi:hypothetical protein